MKRDTQRQLFLLFGDLIIILLSINLAYLVRKNILVDIDILSERIVPIVFQVVVYLIGFYIFNLYNIRLNFRSIRFFSLLVGAFVFISLCTIMFFYVFPYRLGLGRGLFIISLVSTGVLITTWRLFYYILFRIALPPKRVLIIGTGPAADDVYTLIAKNPDYEIIGFVAGTNNGKNPNSNKKILGDSLSLEYIAKERQVDSIVITINPARNKQLKQSLVACKLRGINIYDIPQFYEFLLEKLPISYIKEEWFIYSDGFNYIGNKIYGRFKRVVDLTLSAIFLVLALPLFILISIIIKVSSKGPIFFSQERLGENFQPFMLYKFRTMIADAEQDGPQWAEKDDPRVTKTGKLLRQVRLDELPQLLNIIKGEMSFIGPRPEREFFIKSLMEKIPYYSLRLSAKPGLTGWAQVKFRYGASEKDAVEKLQYDLFYIKNMSLFLDFRIVLKTITVVLFGMGR